MKRQVVSISIIILSIALLEVEASAHSATWMQYPFADETQGVHKSSSGASWPTCPPNCWWEDTFEYAMDPLKNWNEVTPFDGFTIAYLSSMGGQIFGCWWSDPGDNLIARTSFGDGPRGGYASNTRCPQGTNPRNRFYIYLDTDTNWYHTPGDDGVNNTSSAIGIVVHELGHGAGFGDGSAAEHFADPCDGNALRDWQTMCAGEPNNDTDEIWRLITIENHDKHESMRKRMHSGVARRSNRAPILGAE